MTDSTSAPAKEDAKETPQSSSTHKGNCHCNAVRFTATLSPALSEQKVTLCNCSLCLKKGLHFIYLPRDKFILEGEENLKVYNFATNTLDHCFCSKCGVNIVGRPKDPNAYGGLVGVNVRAFKKLDLADLKFNEVDGKKQGNPYPHDD